MSENPGSDLSSPEDRPLDWPHEQKPETGFVMPQSEGPDTVLVDTNVFLRILTNDIPDQAERALALFDRAAMGEVRLVAPLLVVCEVAWTLGRTYKRSKREVARVVLSICHTPGLSVEDADGLVQAAEWHAEKNVDFADAYHVVRGLALGAAAVATFNEKHFRRFDHLPLADL